MAGKICMVTGSSSGVGKSTASALAAMGASVVMVCRDEARGKAARDQIQGETGADPQNLHLMLADLSSFDSVRRLAASFSAKYRVLHVLVNNAGLILGRRIPTRDGLETTFEVNYLSHFLLTTLLLPELQAGAPSRIINVSSSAHTAGHINFDDLQGEKKYSMWRAYSQSKLAQVLFTYELSRRLEGTGVVVNAVHPGAVASNWGRHSAGWLSLVLKFAGPFEINNDEGADTPVYLASSAAVQDVTGKYFYKRHQTDSSRESNDKSVAERLWQVSAELARTN